MTERPSFGKEVFQVLLLLTKVAVPLACWIVLVAWLGRGNVVATAWVMNGGFLVGIVLLSAYWSCKWKRDSFRRDARLDGTPQAISKKVATDQEKLSFSSPVVNRAKPALMPLDYLQPESRRLPDVLPGEEVYVNASDIAVDLAGAVWIDQNAKAYDYAGLFNVKVEAVESSGYVLTILKRDDALLKFTPRPLPSYCKYAPVIQVVDESSPLLT